MDSHSIIRAIDGLFGRLLPTASRWVSFELITDDPLVFSHVHRACEFLAAPSLASLRVSSLYMPGYGHHSDIDPVYDLPFTPAVWFGDHLPSLRQITSYCARLAWTSLAIFSGLVAVELANRSCPTPLHASTLQQLFSAADGLRELRLGALVPALWPSDIVLESSSLRVVDVEFQFHLCALAASILSVMVVPNVTDLTVRNVGSYAYSLLDCRALLSRITRFSIHSETTPDPIFMHQIYSCLPLLNTLDMVKRCSGVQL
ncbi:hypothetical protein FB451DRAFT_1178494 [Mycena latifolia]|nr:hypothetical protein FB451DRAFT_1178494 [Mycena latifolia]